MRVQAVLMVLLAGALMAQPAPAPQPAGPPAGPMLSPNQLDTMVAPIALYPDALLSQVLVACTYPLEIAEANQWMQTHRDLQGQALVDAAREQNWDPSIQALVAFPDVLSRLGADIRWTTDLGNAFLAQQADVMNAVQRMRQEAMASGKLRSGPQETVTTQMEDGQPAVVIEPTNPEVVYVPYYDPAYIWGPPAWGYYPAWDYAGFGFGFFPGIYIGGFWGGLGWGGWGWGLNWWHCAIFNRPFFFNHYGYGGFHGGGPWRGGSVLWAHNGAHRLGVSYPNRALTARYGAASTSARAYSGARSFGQSYSAVGRGGNYAARGNAGTSGGWSRFGQTSRGYSAPMSSYRGSPSNGGNSYGGARTAPNYRQTPSYGGNYSYRPQSPSYRGQTPSYRSAPSYNGGSRSFNPGRSYGGGSAPRSSGGGFHSSGGGGGFHGGGGGGGFHGGGGGGGFHGGGGGGGGHHR